MGAQMALYHGKEGIAGGKRRWGRNPSRELLSDKVVDGGVKLACRAGWEAGATGATGKEQTTRRGAVGLGNGPFYQEHLWINAPRTEDRLSGMEETRRPTRNS